MTGVQTCFFRSVTTSAAWQKIFSDDIRVGFFAAANDMATKLATGVLPPEKAAVAPQLIFNQHLDAYLTLFFVLMLWLVIADMFRMVIRFLAQKTVLPLTEVAYVRSSMKSSL